jgi:carboxylesterase type B
MAALWALIVTLWCLFDFSTAAPTAKTKNGTYEGFHLASYNQDLFLGIPYAQPPLGALRLTNPKSLNSSFNGTKAAISYYPECVGYGGDDLGYVIAEDCLALNVIRPANYSGQKLPVAVWIHGGGLQMGGTADRRYNLSFIVENSVQIGKPIIVVSIAYRLGPWGFLYSAEVRGSGNSNIGLRDQRLALHWIQENIASFGGDPTKVTIWGESAGAYSVGAHIVAYGGRDDKLFRAAIMESGNPVNYLPYLEAGFYQPSYDLIVNQTGCRNQTDTLGCLRSIPYAKLNAVFNQTAFQLKPFEAVIDGDFIQKFTSIQLADGDFVKVPIIGGANTDEGTSFGPVGIENATQFAAYIGGGANPSTQAALPAFLVQEILAAYPDNPSLGIPAELGDERLNATYGMHT